MLMAVGKLLQAGHGSGFQTHVTDHDAQRGLVLLQTGQKGLGLGTVRATGAHKGFNVGGVAGGCFAGCL